MPFLDDEQFALRKLWEAILIAYLSTGLRFNDELINIPRGCYEFKPIINKGLVLEDSHVIKLIYSCYQEFQKSQNPLYYAVAHRAAFNSRS